MSGTFTLSQGETATFVMAYGPDRPATMEHYRTREKLELTQRYWQDLVAGMHYEGLWRDQVVRSFLVLHLMIYRGTGAIVAAPTTSLPETIGGSRNWDYRYSWLRDTSFSVDILYRLGDVYGADFYIQWLLEQCQLNTRRTRILYGITQSSSLEEQVLDHLGGRRAGCAAGGCVHNAELLADRQPAVHWSDGQGPRLLPRDDVAVLQPPRTVRGDV